MPGTREHLRRSLDRAVPPRNARRTPYDARAGTTATSATARATAFSGSRIAHPDRVSGCSVRFGPAVLGEQSVVDVFELSRPFREGQLVLHSSSRRAARDRCAVPCQRRANRGTKCGRSPAGTMRAWHVRDRHFARPADIGGHDWRLHRHGFEDGVWCAFVF